MARLDFKWDSKALAGRLALQRGQEVKNGDEVLAVTEFDVLVAQQRRRGLPFAEAVDVVARFLRSSQMANLPISDISSRLFAGLAMAFRGETGRKPKPGDHIDVDHISYHLPYMDVMVVDRFFASLSCRKGIELGFRYGCEFVSLRGGEVAEFADRVDSWIAASETARVAERVYDAIERGGIHAEFADHARRVLEAKGVDLAEGD